MVHRTGRTGSWTSRKESSILKQRKYPVFPLSALRLTAWSRYDLGIQTFDTANVYSNGLSEVILGKAIKQHNLPRDEIVVMTKV